MADHTYITANCSFVTSFNSLFPYPASDVLGVIKNLKNGKNYEQFKTDVLNDKKNEAQGYVKELYEKSITEIVEKFEGSNVVVGLQELNNNDFAYKTIQNTIEKKNLDYFPVLGGFQTTGNLYPTLGYILPGKIEQYLQATNGIIKPTKEVSPASVDEIDYSEGIMAVRDLGSDNKLTDSTDADIIVKNITFNKYGELVEINDDGRPVSMVVKKRSKPEPSKPEPSKSDNMFKKITKIPKIFSKNRDSQKDSDSDSDSDIASFIYINSHMLNPSLLKKVDQKKLNELKLEGKKCIINFLNENKVSDKANDIADNIEDTELKVKVEEILRTEQATNYKKKLKECAEKYMSEIKTLLQQNDMDTWYTYCQKRFQECISDIVDKNFQNLIVDDDTVVVFFGDFNDPRTHLKKNKLSCKIKGITYEMDIIYDPGTTCCPNENSVYTKTDENDIKNVLVKSPYNKTFSFAMNDNKLDEMFKKYDNFDTPAFTGDYIGVGTNNKKKHFPNVGTNYFDGGSDHKFVKVIFSGTNIPEGGKRRRTRRKNKNKNAKKTNKKGKSKKYRKKGRKTRKIRRRK